MIKNVLLIMLMLTPSALVLSQSQLLSDTIDVKKYTIYLDEVDYSNQFLQGHTRIEGISKINNLSALPFELWGLSVDSIVGQNVSSFEHQNIPLRVFLATPLSQGDSFLVDIYYQGHPLVDPTGWGGFLFQQGVAFNLGVGFGADPHNLGKTWFPCVDDFVDRARYEFFVTTTLDKTAVCGGELLSVSPLGADSTKHVFHWRLDEEIPTYLASVAVSNFQLQADTFQALNGPVPVSLYVQPQYASSLAGSFVHLDEAFHAFEQAFGPYQWPRVGYFNAPVGSMEHACNIAYANGLINGNTNYESTMAHELSHHWFGNLITCESALDMWINEGWASFCEEVFIEYTYGKKEARDYARRNHEKNLRLLHHTEGWMPLYGIPADMTYSSTVYDKGADVAHSLRGYLGDSLFYPVITSLLADSAFEDVSSFEFRDYLSTHTGMDLGPFFDAYVFSAGWNHFSVDSFTVNATTGLYNVQVFLRQQLKEMPAFADHNRLKLTFWSQNWESETHWAEFDGEFGSVSYQLPFVPVACMLDMNEDLMDATTDEVFVVSAPESGTLDESYFKYTVHSLTDSALIRVTQSWIAPEAFLDPPANLILSDSRYWKVEGIFPLQFEAEFKFSYNNNTGANGHFDDSWFTYPMSADSLVLLYRSKTSEDWQIIPSERLGTSRYGYLSTNAAMPGEYTMAYRDRSLGIGLLPHDNDRLLQVYPNPAGASLTIQWDFPGQVEISAMDNLGKAVFNQSFGAGVHSFGLDTSAWKPGVYLFQLRNNKTWLDSVRVLLRP